jgi:uncharacterized protein
VKPVALIDTHVWVSALINPHGPPARLTDAWLQGEFAEIGEVLRRPRIKRKYGISEEEIVQYLQLIAARTALASVTGQMTICRDPDDNLILEAALVGAPGLSLRVMMI